MSASTAHSAESATRERYAAAAHAPEAALCCPVLYDPRHLEILDEELKKRPIRDAASFLAADALADELRVKHPLVATESVDVVVSNCVLNLVDPQHKQRLFGEIFRVLRSGGRAVIYKGPFLKVLDDDGHTMERGLRYAVCDKTFQLYRKAPYREFFEFIEPRLPIPAAEAHPFDCTATRLRHPKETKGHHYDATTEASQCCEGGDAATCC